MSGGGDDGGCFLIFGFFLLLLLSACKMVVSIIVETFYIKGTFSTNSLAQSLIHSLFPILRLSFSLSYYPPSSPFHTLGHNRSGGSFKMISLSYHI